MLRKSKQGMKKLLGQYPFAAEWYWRIRQRGGPPPGGFVLNELEGVLPQWVNVAEKHGGAAPSGKDIFIFGMGRHWITHAMLTALGLRGLGHKISFGFTPHLSWKEAANSFDTYRQNIYIKHVLKPAQQVMNILPIIELEAKQRLPERYQGLLSDRSLRDVKYTLMREDVGKDSETYRFRRERNRFVLSHLYPWLSEHRPDFVIVPNGSVLQFGAVFSLARDLEIPVVTYEFGEQKNRIWLALNGDVMRQQTNRMWDAYQDEALGDEEWSKIKDLFAARRGADRWQQFSRQWQKTSSKGEEKIRSLLDLDRRPVVLLPTNVLGDSLTLGREIFSESMTEWILQTMKYFMDKPEYQLVVRIHPGEQLSWGPSVQDILKGHFSSLPNHIHLVGPEDEINSYDLLDITSLVIVFTTTLGLEAAMSGLPVIVVGETHYRGKGFTIDPQSWDEYYAAIKSVMRKPQDYVLEEDEIEKAWTYAYRFFFDYPFPFPWHVRHFGEDIVKWPLHRVLSDEGQEKFGRTFQYLTGKPINWLGKVE